MDFLAVSGSGIGLWVADGPKPVVWNRCGAPVAIGEVVMFDMADTQGETDKTAAQGTDSDILANVITPTTAGIGTLVGGGPPPHAGYWFGIVIDLLDGAGADNTRIRVQMWGRFKALTPNNAIAGEQLAAANASRVMVEGGAANNKVLAFVVEDNTSGGNALRTVIFDGVHGIGYTVTS